MKNFKNVKSVELYEAALIVGKGIMGSRHSSQIPLKGQFPAHFHSFPLSLEKYRKSTRETSTPELLYKIQFKEFLLTNRVEKNTVWDRCSTEGYKCTHGIGLGLEISARSTWKKRGNKYFASKTMTWNQVLIYFTKQVGISQNWLSFLKGLVDFQLCPLHKFLLQIFPTEFQQKLHFKSPEGNIR